MVMTCLSVHQSIYFFQKNSSPFFPQVSPECKKINYDISKCKARLENPNITTIVRALKMIYMIGNFLIMNQ
jgi:hypothetical protein